MAGRAELVFYAGTMDCGKSTLALQTDFNHRSRGRAGLVLTRLDRAGSSVLSSRLGIEAVAVEVEEDLDIREMAVERLQAGMRLDYLICDEAQFYTAEQIDQLAAIVDDLGIDVYAFGILTDFRTLLFPGSARLVELADRVQPMQVEALCWCGARAIHNARTVDGDMVVEGSQVLVGDTRADAGGPDGAGVVAYEVLCRTHYRQRMTASRAMREHMSSQPLPFEEPFDQGDA